MSYEHFKRTIWSKYIQTELGKECNLVADCNTQFQGEAKLGNQVKILGVNRPSISKYNQSEGLGVPETPADNSKLLLIDQADSFNFMVDDIDKAQSVEGLMPTLMKEAVEGMAESRDTYVGSLAAGADENMISTSTAITTSANAKKAIDAALLALRENDVKLNDNVVITVSPFVYQLFRDALVEFKTNNDDLIRKGVVGMYDNCEVKMSNCLYNDGTDDYLMVRTKRAIAFASAIDDLEPYRPEKFFADALKGLSVYGGKIIRPKELYVIKAHK